MTSEAGSIGTMPRRAARVGSRKRLRLISRVEPSRASRMNVQTQLPSSERQARTCSGSTRSTPHPVRPVADRVAEPRVLELGQDPVGAVHVEAEEVLDPVVGVRPAARRRADLGDPWPDRVRRRVDLDRPRRDPVGVFEQLVARQRRGRLCVRRSPGEDRLAQKPSVEDGEPCERDGSLDELQSWAVPVHSPTGTPSTPRMIVMGRFDSDTTPRETLPRSAEASVP